MVVIYGFSIKRFFLLFPCPAFFLFFVKDNILQDNKVELLTNISFYAHMYSHFFVATQTQNVMNIQEEREIDGERKKERRTFKAVYCQNLH